MRSVTHHRAAEGWLRICCLAIAATLAIVLTLLAVVSMVGVDGMGNAVRISPAAVVLAGLLYVASHLVRIARLALIAGDSRLSLRSLAAVHVFTAGVSLALPFKLGDVYRMVEVSALAGGFVRGATIVFVERTFDVAVILIMLLVGLNFGSASAGSYGPVLAASLLFVCVILLVIVIVPDNLRRFANYIIRRYDRPWTVEALKLIYELRSLIASTAHLLRGRYPSLLAFTLVIWGLEASSLGVILAAYTSNFQPVGALLTFLSSISEGETLLGRLASGQPPLLPPEMLAYMAGTQFPLVLLSLIGGTHLVKLAIAKARCHRIGITAARKPLR